MTRRGGNVGGPGCRIFRSIFQFLCHPLPPFHWAPAILSLFHDPFPFFFGFFFSAHHLAFVSRFSVSLFLRGLFTLSFPELVSIVSLHHRRRGLYTGLLVAGGGDGREGKNKGNGEGRGVGGERGRGRGEAERADTRTIYTRAAHKSGPRIVAASSAARATINSPLLLSASLLGAPLCVRTRSSPYRRPNVSPLRIVRGPSVLPTSPCFIERFRSLFRLPPFCLPRLRRGAPPPTPPPSKAASLISTWRHAV